MHDEIRRGVLEKMPPPQIKEESRVLGEAAKKTKKGANRKSKLVAKPTTDQDLLDLMGDDATSNIIATPTNGNQNNTDLLADILGGATSPPHAASPPPQQNNVSSIMDLFSQGPSAPPAQTSSPAPTSSGLDALASFGTPPPQQSAVAAAPAGFSNCSAMPRERSRSWPASATHQGLISPTWGCRRPYPRPRSYSS